MDRTEDEVFFKYWVEKIMNPFYRRSGRCDDGIYRLCPAFENWVKARAEKKDA